MSSVFQNNAVRACDVPVHHPAAQRVDSSQQQRHQRRLPRLVIIDLAVLTIYPRTVSRYCLSWAHCDHFSVLHAARAMARPLVYRSKTFPDSTASLSPVPGDQSKFTVISTLQGDILPRLYCYKTFLLLQYCNKKNLPGLYTCHLLHEMFYCCS